MHHNDIIISSMCMLIKRQGLGIYMKNVKQLNVCVNLVGIFLVYFLSNPDGMYQHNSRVKPVLF